MLLFLFLITSGVNLVSSTYKIPFVNIEAFFPKGFRASIPDQDGIKLFAFHGKINERIAENSVGDFYDDILKSKDGLWIFEDPNLQLHVGDRIFYWVFVQHDVSRYKKDNLSFTVAELLDPRHPLNNQVSSTTVNGQRISKDKLFFEDNFEKIDGKKWLITKYIPTLGENFEFNYYSPDAVSVKESQLIIKPTLIEDESKLRGILDLKNGCTSKNPEECFYEQKGAFYLPPVKSGAIKSRISFKYGKIDIKCKLPCGDWIYPEIRLVPKDSTKTPLKITLIYSRGNEYLRGNDGTDIGGRLLMSGPTLNASEPERSQFWVSTYNSDEPFCRKEHLYSMTWKPGEILFHVDGKNYGRIDTAKNNKLGRYLINDESEYELYIGVGIGGIHEFPNDFTSTGGYGKPWTNKDVKQIRDFYRARNLWLQTWRESDTFLSVNSIKMYSV